MTRDGSNRTVIIACGATKTLQAAPARDLYCSAHFQFIYRAAARLAGDGQIWILSARHGLVHPERILEPYDCRLGDRDAVTAASIDVTVLADPIHTLLPAAYAALLHDAVTTAGRRVEHAWFAGTRGIGAQRSVAAAILHG